MSPKKKSNILIVMLFILGISLNSCRKKSINCGEECYQNEELLFNFGFEGVKLIQNGNKAEFSGIDTAYNTKNNWDIWKTSAQNSLGYLNINYEDGDLNQRKAEITVDPLNSSNHVLHYQINSSNVFKRNKPYKSRIQMQYHNTKCIKNYYQKVKIMLPSSMEMLKNYNDKIYWLSIFELWNNANWTNEKYPFRITVDLVKIKESYDQLHFHVKAQTYNRLNNFKNIWEETATDFNIPFNKWMEIELYVNEGNKENGRFYLAVTPDGLAKKVLFDINHYTQHPKEKCPDGFTQIHPLKWYTSAELTEFFENQNQSLEIYWDDWRVWRNKKP